MKCGEYGSRVRQGQRETKAFSTPIHSALHGRRRVRWGSQPPLPWATCYVQLKNSRQDLPSKKEINNFLVLLLLSLQDNNTDVVKVLVSSVLPTSAWFNPFLLEDSPFPLVLFHEPNLGSAFTVHLFGPTLWAGSEHFYPLSGSITPILIWFCSLKLCPLTWTRPHVSPDPSY